MRKHRICGIYPNLSFDKRQDFDVAIFSYYDDLVSLMNFKNFYPNCKVFLFGTEDGCSNWDVFTEHINELRGISKYGKRTRKSGENNTSTS